MATKTGMATTLQTTESRNKPKAFYVKWVDAASSARQSWTDEAPAPVAMESLGFLHTVDPEYITLVMNLSEDGEFSGDISIPAGCLLEMKEINAI